MSLMGALPARAEIDVRCCRVTRRRRELESSIRRRDRRRIIREWALHRQDGIFGTGRICRLTARWADSSEQPSPRMLNTGHGACRMPRAVKRNGGGRKAGLPPERGWPLLPFFQAGCCEGLSSGEVESVSASIFVNKSFAPARKSRKVGALDLSSNASSSGVASETNAGLSSLAIILFFAS
jgi:hypothetical protein